MGPYFREELYNRRRDIDFDTAIRGKDLESIHQGAVLFYHLLIALQAFSKIPRVP